MNSVQVTGFDGHLLALNGMYLQDKDANHGKPMYKKKTTEIDGCTESCIYFWDSRDGEALSGWWVAPIVGGEQVWAFCPSQVLNPPPCGWRVPWHHSVADPNLKMVLRTAGAVKRPGDMAGAPGTKKPNTTGGQMKGKPGAQAEIKARRVCENLEAKVTAFEAAVDRATKEGISVTESTRLVGVAKNQKNELQKYLEDQDKNAFKGELAAFGDKLPPFQQRFKVKGAELDKHEEVNAAEAKKRFEELTQMMPQKCDEYLKKIEELVENTKDETVVLTCELGEHSSPEDILEVQEKAETTTKEAQKLIQELKGYLGECEAQFRTLSGEQQVELQAKKRDSTMQTIAFERELMNVKKTIQPAVSKAKHALSMKKKEEENQQRRLEQQRLQELTRVKSLKAGEIGIYAESLYKKVTQQEDSSIAQLEEAQSQLLGLYNLLDADLQHKDSQPSLKVVLTKHIHRIKKGMMTVDLKQREESSKTQEFDDRFAVQLGVSTQKYMESEEGMDSKKLFAKISGDAEEATYAQVLEFYKEHVVSDVPACVESDPAILNDYMPRIWRKAVIAAMRRELCADAGKKEKLSASGEKKITDEEKLELITKCTNADVTEEEALSKKIMLPEFELFIEKVYYVCTKPCQMTNAKEVTAATGQQKDALVCQLDCDDVIKVIDGPESVDGGAPNSKVMRVRGVRTRDGLEGWINMREPRTMVSSVEKYNHLYQIFTETVLTDTYELKGFKVIRRVKKDEKVIALSLPVFNKEAELLRVQVRAMSDGAEGWITVKGSQGTLFLQSSAVKDIQAKAKANQQNSGWNVQKSEEGKNFVLVANDKKIFGKELSEEELQQALTCTAEELPVALRTKMSGVEETKKECEAIIQELKEIDAKAAAEAEEASAVKETGDVAMPDADKTPVLVPEFEAELKGKIEACDGNIRSIRQVLQSVKTDMQFYSIDLQGVQIPKELLEKPKEEKKEDAENKEDAGEDKEDAGENKEDAPEVIDVEMEVEKWEPDLTNVEPFVKFKFFLYKLQKELEQCHEFLKEIQKNKLNVREALMQKWTAYKKALETKEIKDQVAKLKVEIEERTKTLEEKEAVVVEKANAIQGNNVAEEEVSANTEKIFSAAKLSVLGEDLGSELKEMEEMQVEMLAWVKGANPQNLMMSNAEKTARYRLVPHAEKMVLLNSVAKPYEALKQKVVKLKQRVNDVRDYLENTLEADIVLRSRTEIATYFQDRDPKEIFLSELAPQNPDNTAFDSEDGKDDDKKTIDFAIAADFIEKELQPEPVPKTFVSRVYSSLVGNTSRPMTLDEFCNLFAKMHYRVIKETIMTDEFDIAEKPFKKIGKLQVGEIVRLVTECRRTKSGILRFKAETLPPQTNLENAILEGEADIKKGYVTLEGNKKSVFFQLHTPGYKVVKQTVLTDIFEMNNFRPLVRLNVGDQVRAIGFPRKEGKSGLVRVKATTVGHKDGKEFTGFVTVEGNQNSVYLESCETLKFPEEPKKAEEEEEAKPAEAAEEEAKPTEEGNSTDDKTD